MFGTLLPGAWDSLEAEVNTDAVTFTTKNSYKRICYCVAQLLPVVFSWKSCSYLQRANGFDFITLIFQKSSLLEKVRYKIIHVAIAKGCSRSALNESASDSDNSCVFTKSKSGKLNGKRLIFRKSHISTHRCSHRDDQSQRRERRLHWPYSTTSTNLEHNTKMCVTIKSSRQLCRLYILKQPLPFLPSPHRVAPHDHEGTKAFDDSGSLSCPTARKISSCLPRDHERCQLLPRCVCGLQRAYSWLQPPCVSSHWFPMGWTEQPPPQQGFHSEFLQALIKAEISVQAEEESVQQHSGCTCKA